MDLKFSRNRFLTKGQCPCGKSNKDGKFSPSVDAVGNYAGGNCFSCGLIFDKHDRPISKKDNEPFNNKKRNHVTNVNNIKPISYIDKNTYRITIDRQRRVSNNLYCYLYKLTRNIELVDFYFDYFNIGTGFGQYEGYTIFWYINEQEQLLNGKAIKYAQNGKRIKEVPIKWIGLSANGYIRCLYNQRELVRKKAIVYLVESEKSALIGSICFPQYIWLATSGKQFNINLLAPLSGRNLVLLPDFDKNNECINVWLRLGIEGHQKYKFASAKLNVEYFKYNFQKIDGFDIADCLIKEIENVVTNFNIFYPNSPLGFYSEYPKLGI